MDQALKDIRNLHFKARDYLDDPNHPAAKALVKETQRLLDSIEGKRDPDYLFNQVDQLERTLRAAIEAKVMDTAHGGDLADRCRDLKRDLRNLA